ncbi:ankyrin repeat-containing domain protein [Xylaria cf. heliscus]|nr:ankyrin repeat-containing domain protein [Xylaria cf. heliscus]
MATGPPLWQEPPVFNLPCVSSRISPPLPKTYAVLIQGIDGQTSPQLVEAHQATFLDPTLTITFKYKPCMIAGDQATDETSSQVASNLLDFIEKAVESWEDDLSIMFFAYDLGGIILKQAFTNISTRDQYRRILDRTSLVVFYGTPHQSSGSQAWKVSVLRILHSCYKGLLGPWVPAYMEWISQYQQKLDQRFRALASSFRVMNVCQKGLSPNYEFITDPLCAILGASNEETVLLERSHYQLGYILGHNQRESMEGRMRDAVIYHWEYYRAFVSMLRLVSHQNFRSPIPDRPLQELPLELFLTDPKAVQWEKTSLPSKIRLVLRGDMSAEDLYTVFAQHVAARTGGEATLVLRLGPEHHCKEPSTLAQVYAALCIQFLEQQPSLILWIRHLYANLRDAVLGVDNRWKLRVLRRCLKTLLLTPRRGMTYCLIHITSDNSREDVVAQILSTTRESEIPLRLLVTTPKMEKAPIIFESWDCVDLSSMGGLLKGSTTRMKESLLGTPNALARNEPSNPMLEMKPDNNMMPALGQRRRLPFEWCPRVRSPETVLSGCVDDDMAWVLRATAWIVYAVRPLSRHEVEQISDIICAEEASLPVGMQHGEALFQILEYSLSGFLHVSEDAVWASPGLGSGLRSVWAKSALALDPELYVAQQCFSIAASLFQRNNIGVASCPAPVTPDTAVPEVPGQDDNDRSVTAVNTYEDSVPPLTRSYGRAIEEYVTRFWIQHQHSLTSRLGEVSDHSQGTLDTRTLFDCNAWIQKLTSSNWAKDIETVWGAKVRPEFMEKTYQLSPFDACCISFRLATLPLGLEDDFEWLFISIAKEYLREDAYIGLVMNVVGQLSDTSRDSMLQRLIGTATPDFRSKLLAKYGTDFFQENLLEILLTAIATGNSTVVTEMLGSASNLALGDKPKQKEDSQHRLGTALQIACEYGDIDIVQSLLSLKVNESALELEVLYHWSALHVACHQGYRVIVEAFMDQSTKHTIQLLNRDQYCPLLVTSAHGLFNISDLLKGFEMQVPASEESTSSPMQLAAKYGFPLTLKSLINDHGCKMLLKSQKDNILSLAIESGNEEVMSQAKEAFSDAIHTALDQCMPIGSSTDDRDSDNDESMSSWDRVVKEAEGIQGHALLTAVECGGAPPEMEFLLWSRGDFKVKDPKGRTPLMIASRMGCIDLCRALFVKDDEQSPTMETALHYACSHGNLQVVEFLIGTKKFSLTIKGERSLTPMMAAAIGGHLQIVKVLLSHMSDKVFKDEFLDAAMLGQETVMDMILKTAVEMGHNAHNDYINASGEYGSTALYFAATGNHTRAVEFLLRRRPNLEKQSGQFMLTPLASAAYSSAMESMKLLLDAGASTETFVRGSRKRLVLTDSIFFEEAPVVKLLLEYGAKPRLPEYWGFSGSLLHFTIANSTNAIFKILLEHFHKVSNSVRFGPLPQGIPTATQALQTVIKHGTVESLDTLLQVWDKFDQEVVENGFTFGSTFKYAAYHGSLGMLEKLWSRFKNDIDVNDTRGYYGSALQAAIIGSRDSLGKVRALLEWNAMAILPSSKSEASMRDAYDISEAEDVGPFHGYWSTILHAAVSAGDEAVVEAILKLDGISTDQPDRMGRLPLHIASLNKDWEFMQMLLSPESTVESTDSQGRNALHIACGGGNFGFVQELVKDKLLASRIIDRTDDDGWTPLHWACRSRNLALVDFLTREGARRDVKTRDGRNWLPYHVAIYHGWGTTVESTLKGESRGIDDVIEVGTSTRAICGYCGCAIYGVRYQCTNSLRLREAELSEITAKLDFMSNNIRALEKDKRSLEIRVADLETSAVDLQRLYDTVTGQHDAALAEMRALSRRVRELEDGIAEKEDSLAAQSSEVTRLAVDNNNLQDGLIRKDSIISELNTKLNLERVGHKNTEQQRLQAELAGRYSRRESHTLCRLIGEGLAEIDGLEDKVRETSDTLNHVRSLSAKISVEYHLHTFMKDEELLKKEQDSARKDTELAQANADLVRSRTNLEQKTIEVERVKEEFIRKNTDLLRRITTSDSVKADLTQRNTNLALLLMGQRNRGQDIDGWLPLINSVQLPKPATQPPIDRYSWWTVEPSWSQQNAHSTPTWLGGLLESVALLYSETITNQYDKDGCAAFRIIIRCLEVAEVAPIAMIMELLNCLLTNVTREFDSYRTQFAFLFGTCQVVDLIRLRWPETEKLDYLGSRCQEKFTHAPPDFQLIRELVSGVDCGKQLISAFESDIPDQEILPVLSAIPHKHCPGQRTVLIAPITTSFVWALDLRRHKIWMVGKQKGDFHDDGSYHLQAAEGEDIMVPSETSDDLNFIFDHLD